MAIEWNETEAGSDAEWMDARHEYWVAVGLLEALLQDRESAYTLTIRGEITLEAQPDTHTDADAKAEAKAALVATLKRALEAAERIE